MVLLPGCPCCVTCEGVGALCKYQISVDGGSTWTAPALTLNTPTVLQLPGFDVDGAFIEPRVEVVSRDDSQGRNPRLQIEFGFNFVGGSRGTTGRAILQISGLLNTLPNPDDYVFVATFGAQISSFGRWEGVDFFPGVYGAGQNACYFISQCVTDPNPSIACSSLFSNQEGSHFYLPNFTASNEVLGSKPSQQLRTTFTAESPSVRIYETLGFLSPSFLTPVSFSTPLTSFDSPYINALHELWDYLFTTSFIVKANPLP